MKKYNVEVIENLSRVIEVDADSYVDAEDKVQEMYNDERIILDWNDCNDVEYRQYPACKIKDNINLSLEYDKEENMLHLSSEDGSGSKYSCRDIDDLKNNINLYIDNYIELIKEENIEMER